MTLYQYRSLPSGNQADFPLIDAELKKREVRAEVSELRTGGRIYRIPVDELHKLPIWEDEPYLPMEEDAGWGLFPASDWEETRVEWGGTDWAPIP